MKNYALILFFLTAPLFAMEEQFSFPIFNLHFISKDTPPDTIYEKAFLDGVEKVLNIIDESQESVLKDEESQKIEQKYQDLTKELSKFYISDPEKYEKSFDEYINDLTKVISKNNSLEVPENYKSVLKNALIKKFTFESKVFQLYEKKYKTKKNSDNNNNNSKKW